jgi:dissimilatory sulfite reductase (desulfoviridin) alpha/beta subunit
MVGARLFGLRKESLMAGKFLSGAAMYDTKKSEERTNAEQKRSGQQFHVRVTSCGCPDPACGAFHVIETDRPLPSQSEAAATLQQAQQE